MVYMALPPCCWEEASDDGITGQWIRQIHCLLGPRCLEKGRKMPGPGDSSILALQAEFLFEKCVLLQNAALYVVTE
jgi:hypothetical protein